MKLEGVLREAEALRAATGELPAAVTTVEEVA